MHIIHSCHSVVSNSVAPLSLSLSVSSLPLKATAFRTVTLPPSLLPALLVLLPRINLHPISVSLEAQGTGLLRNFRLLPLFHSSQMMSSQKSQSFTLWLTCKKVASSPIALQHRESVFCFCDQIQCVLMILCLQVYFTYRQEDVKYRAVLCVCSFCFSERNLLGEGEHIFPLMNKYLFSF